MKPIIIYIFQLITILLITCKSGNTSNIIEKAVEFSCKYESDPVSLYLLIFKNSNNYRLFY